MRECQMANHPFAKARELQRALYRAAKRSATRRFHALYDKVYREDILRWAWQLVKANRGAAGIDGQTLAEIEWQGVDAFLAELACELREGRYRPLPVRRVYIPKPDARLRPLGIPAVRDRVVQAALKLVIEPIFEADFQPCSYGFRPKRSAHQASEAVRQLANGGYEWVVDADIANYFETINHEKLLLLVARRISDRRVLKLIRQFLKAGVLEEGRIRRATTGTPQGGVLSPLLANIYLNYLDRLWLKHCARLGELVRYADDLVILCRREQDARTAWRHLEVILARLDLTLHPEKTRLVNLHAGREGFDFLGFHHRKVRSWRWRRYYLLRWPSARAMQAVRDKIKAIIGGREALNRGLEEVITELNSILRGWGNYFAMANSARKFAAVDRYVYEKLCLFLGKKHGKAGRGWRERWRHVNFYAMGLYRLSGTVRWHKTVHATG
ncbi:MAG TPA: group II intron reverse transcriptase/maturase [Peptococcaceae bacterium]|nr:group II intron reverse transcriptase/maturase [Peptococcaceae bacterium]